MGARTRFRHRVYLFSNFTTFPGQSQREETTTIVKKLRAFLCTLTGHLFTGGGTRGYRAIFMQKETLILMDKGFRDRRYRTRLNHCVVTVQPVTSDSPPDCRNGWVRVLLGHKEKETSSQRMRFLFLLWE